MMLAAWTPAFLHEHLGTVSSLWVPANSVTAVVTLSGTLRHVR
jgi:hypothetical protein